MYRERKTPCLPSGNWQPTQRSGHTNITQKVCCGHSLNTSSNCQWGIIKNQFTQLRCCSTFSLSPCSAPATQTLCASQPQISAQTQQAGCACWLRFMLTKLHYAIELHRLRSLQTFITQDTIASPQKVFLIDSAFPIDVFAYHLQSTGSNTISYVQLEHSTGLAFQPLEILKMKLISKLKCVLGFLLFF